MNEALTIDQDLKHPNQERDMPAVVEEIGMVGGAATAGDVIIQNDTTPAPSLEKLRGRLRGSDKLVERVGSEEDIEQLTEILKHPKTHSRQELQDAVTRMYSAATYGKNAWRLKDHVHFKVDDTEEERGWRRNWKEVDSEYAIFLNTYPDLSDLSIDPGFMTHIPEFMELAKTGDINTKDPVVAREQLKKKLGYKTVWRGTMMTDEEVNAIKEDGFISPLGNEVSQSDHPVETFEAVAISTFVSNTVDMHFHGEHHASPLLSVSEHRDVAIAVGRHYASGGPKKKCVLFKLNMPVIDILKPTDHAYPTPSFINEKGSSAFYEGEGYPIEITIDGESNEYRWDGSVESFVYWKINPEEIADIEFPDVTTTGFHGRTTTKGEDGTLIKTR